MIHTKYEPDANERREIVDLLGDSAFMLYQYYFRMASIPDKSMEDSDASKYFGWSIRKVADNRKKLEKEGYFHKISYTSAQGNKATSYYISKDRVQTI